MTHEDNSYVTVEASNGDVYLYDDWKVVPASQSGGASLASGAETNEGDDEPTRFTESPKPIRSNARLLLNDALATPAGKSEVDRRLHEQRRDVKALHAFTDSVGVVNAPIELIYQTPDKYLSQVFDTATGIFWDAPKEALWGTVQILAHPVKTTQGIYVAVTNPGATIEALKNSIGETIQHGSLEEQGKLAGNILMIFIPAPKMGAVVGKFAEGTEIASKIVKSLKELKPRLVLLRKGSKVVEDLGEAAANPEALEVAIARLEEEIANGGRTLEELDDLRALAERIGKEEPLSAAVRAGRRISKTRLDQEIATLEQKGVVVYRGLDKNGKVILAEDIGVGLIEKDGKLLPTLEIAKDGITDVELAEELQHVEQALRDPIAFQKALKGKGLSDAMVGVGVKNVLELFKVFQETKAEKLERIEEAILHATFEKEARGSILTNSAIKSNNPSQWPKIEQFFRHEVKEMDRRIERLRILRDNVEKIN